MAGATASGAAAVEVSDDDEDFSFSSDCTNEPDDELRANSNCNSNSKQNPRRVHWTPPHHRRITFDPRRNSLSIGGKKQTRQTCTGIGVGIGTGTGAGSSPGGLQLAVEMKSGNNSESSTAIVGLGGDCDGDGSVGKDERKVSLGGRILGIITELLPSFFLTCSIQFIDLLAGVHLFLVGLLVFQALFWPSLAYLLYSKLWKKSHILKPLSTFSDGKWVNLFLLQVHALVTVGAVLLQLLSIEYLNVTVSLAMSFLPCIILVLMEHIMQEKSCSLELILTLVFGYAGVVCAAIPSLLAEHPNIQSRLYNGVAASIASSLLCIEASLLLSYLRNRSTEDSLVTTSIGLQGTVLCGVIGASMNVVGPLRKSNAGFVSGILLFTLVGISLLITQTKRRGERKEMMMRRRREEERLGEGESEGTLSTSTSPSSEAAVPTSPSPSNIHHISIVKQRVLIFALSSLWGLLKQFYTHTFPSVFSVVGVTLIVTSFLFSMAFKEWNAMVKQRENDRENQRVGAWSKSRSKNFKLFQFIPWLFSREPIFFIH